MQLFNYTNIVCLPSLKKIYNHQNKNTTNNNNCRSSNMLSI